MAAYTRSSLASVVELLRTIHNSYTINANSPREYIEAGNVATCFLRLYDLCGPRPLQSALIWAGLLDLPDRIPDPKDTFADPTPINLHGSAIGAIMARFLLISGREAFEKAWNIIAPPKPTAGPREPNPAPTNIDADLRELNRTLRRETAEAEAATRRLPAPASTACRGRCHRVGILGLRR